VFIGLNRKPGFQEDSGTQFECWMAVESAVETPRRLQSLLRWGQLKESLKNILHSLQQPEYL